jgi:hypothetical protein
MQPFSATEREEREEPILSDYNKLSGTAEKGQSDVTMEAERGGRRAADGARIALGSPICDFALRQHLRLMVRLARRARR